MPRLVHNPPSRFESRHLTWDDAHLDAPPPSAELVVLEEEARSILSENESPDVGFRFSVNAYRGCYHGCAYCYARPSHTYLGHGAGTDFERRIVVKTNAVALLKEAFDAPRWKGETVALSGNTDCYQPLEAKYGLTRGLLELCLAYKNPVSVITKGALVRRDLDVLAALSRVTRLRVTISAAFRDDETARAIEPWASPISRRFEAMRALADAGVTVGLSTAPVIPGLNDDHLPELLARAKEAGARFAFMLPVRLSRELLPVFDARLEEALPMRAAKVRGAIREMRGGAMNESGFGARMRGEGPRWAATERLFRLHAERLGLENGESFTETETTFERPKRQLSLF